MNRVNANQIFHEHAGNLPKNSSWIKYEKGLSLFQVAEQIQNFVASLSLNTEHGYGTVETEEGKYTGDLNGGIPEGTGTVIVPIGQYCGHFVKGIPCGQGKMTVYDIIVSGAFMNGIPNGEGEAEILNHVPITNSLRDGFFNVSDIIPINRKVNYKGGFLDGKFHGYGRYTHTFCEIYEGEWKNGQKNGYGKHYFGLDSLNEGEWKEGVYLGEI